MKLKKLLGFILAIAMVLSLMPVAFAAGTTITVKAVIEITENTVFENTNYVRAEGYTGTIFSVADGVTLTLKNCTIDGGAAWNFTEGKLAEALEAIKNGGKANSDILNYITLPTECVDATASLIVLNGAADLTLTGTTIENFYTTSSNYRVIQTGTDANTVTLSGAVIRKVAGYKSSAIVGLSSYDTLNIEGATKIYDNIGAHPGALISICGTETTAEDTVLNIGGTAEFYNNISVNGSMLMVRRSTGNMTGGNFHDNYALYTGGNSNCVPVYVHDYTDFAMTGGEISNNYSYFGGAIVCMANSELNLTGGTIGEAKEGSQVAASVVVNTAPTTVGEDMKISGGFYTNGAVENNGTITGDVHVYGSIENNGTINGDVALGDSATITNTGTITGEVNQNGSEVVVTVNGTPYDTLQEALNTAAAGSGNVTVEILDDIDLTAVDWNPVTVSAPGYPLVTVNGNGHTISNLNDMLFAGTWAGKSGLIINDLTIKDSTIVNDKDDTVGTVGVGAFIGYPQASAIITLKNCHLVDSYVEGGHWTGGLIGMAGGYNGNDGPVFMNLEITGCSVTGSTITGKGSAGGVIGHGSCAAWTNVVIENTTVSGNTVTSTGSSTNKAGTVMGTIGAAGQATTAAGQTKTGGASISVTESGNNVASNGTKITTVYGRQGTETGVLVLTGGTYDNYPIEKDVAYAVVGDGLKIVKNANGTYGVYDENYTPAPVGPTLYTITKAACENGKVTAQAVMAAQGSTIKVSAVPADGYKVASLTVTDAAGNEIEIVDGKIKMPASNVTVSATFVYDLPFEDVADDAENYAAIAYMYENGLMVGTSTEKYIFDGDVKMTRSQIAMILYNLAGEPETAYTGVFTDAPEGAWYTEAVEWAASKGIMVGVGDGTFAHNRQITVVEMAALIYRYAQCQLYGQCGGADWATESAAAMTWCVENGVLAEGTVPTDIADRNLAAEMFYAVYNLLNK